MKKLFALLTLLLFGLSITLVQAQNTQPAKQQTPHSTTTTTKKVVHTKKNGTPDKRYKENKTTTTVHLKKNGTPDKRYKENKTTVTKKVTTSKKPANKNNQK